MPASKDIDTDATEFLTAYYRQLMGGQITGFRLEPDAFGEEPWPIFTLTMPSGETLEMSLSRDPEGNGAGFAFIGPPAPLRPS